MGQSAVGSDRDQSAGARRGGAATSCAVPTREHQRAAEPGDQRGECDNPIWHDAGITAGGTGQERRAVDHAGPPGRGDGRADHRAGAAQDVEQALRDLEYLVGVAIEVIGHGGPGRMAVAPSAPAIDLVDRVFRQVAKLSAAQDYCGAARRARSVRDWPR